MSEKTYISIDLKSFYSSVECMERHLDPLTTIAIQEIIKEYQRQKTNQRSRKGGSARKPQQYHAEAEVII